MYDMKAYRAALEDAAERERQDPDVRPDTISALEWRNEMILWMVGIIERGGSIEDLARVFADAVGRSLGTSLQHVDAATADYFFTRALQFTYSAACATHEDLQQTHRDILSGKAAQDPHIKTYDNVAHPEPTKSKN